MTTNYEQDGLAAEIRRHDRLYHDEQRPELTDAEYDELRGRAEADGRSPGYPPSARFAPAPHPEPMLSLANAFSWEDFLNWHDRAAKALGTDEFPMTAELKIDGIALRLEYRNGSLSLAATRGDGAVGETVTETARTVANLPQELGQDLKIDLDVRGEVYLPVSSFDRLNRERESAGQPLYANPRNAAAGAVRQHDAQEAARRGLKFWAYSRNRTPGQEPLPSHRMELDKLERQGFPVNPEKLTCCLPETVREYYEEIRERRETLDYHIDGIVVKADLKAHQEMLGSTGHEPRWAIAWKFPAERRATYLKDIRISVGRLGKLTPVAVLEPVRIGGVTVQSASLHNEDYIVNRDIRRGDRVIIERAGDVIPQVLGPERKDPDRNLERFRMPGRCPACRTEVVRSEGDAAHRCVNPECGSRLPELLKHFASKDAMDIDGMGEHWCEAIVEAGLVKNPADVYFLAKERLVTLDRMGDKLADRILAGIETSKERPLDRALYSLGIFRLGRTVSRSLTEAYGDLDNILALDAQTMSDEVDGIGIHTAESIIAGLKSRQAQETIARMKQAGVRAMNETAAAATAPHRDLPAFGRAESGLPWSRLNFVVTGRIEGMTRPQAEQAIRQLGGGAAGTVTKNTHFLVAGEKPGSKLAKARQLGIQVMSAGEFAAALGDPGSLTRNNA